MAIAPRGGHPTFAQDFGHGPRRALAIHCTLAHSGAWAAMAGEIAEAVTLTAFDVPGHGQSADWDGRSDFIDLTARVAAGFLDDLGDGQIDLIGHSGGGVAALRLAMAMPEAVRSLTLIEPVLFAAARGFPEWEPHAAAMAAYAEAMQAGDRDAAAGGFMAVWGNGTPWAALDPRHRSYIADRIHLIAASNVALQEDAGGLLRPDGLESLTMPVMLIAGQNSPPIVHRINEEIAARLPDVGVAQVEGAGHMLPISHAAQVAGLVDVNINRA